MKNKVYTVDDMRKCWEVAKCGLKNPFTHPIHGGIINNIQPIGTFDEYLKILNQQRNEK